jgi:hypothetical protein
MLSKNQKVFLALIYWYAMEHANDGSLEEVPMHPIKWDAGQISHFPLWKKMKKLPKKNDIKRLLQELKALKLLIHPDAVYLSRDGVRAGMEVYEEFLAKYSTKVKKTEETRSTVVMENMAEKTQQEKVQDMISTIHVESPTSGYAIRASRAPWYLFSKYAVFLEALIPFLYRSLIESLSNAAGGKLITLSKDDRLAVENLKGNKFLTETLHFTPLLRSVYRLLECIDQYFDHSDLSEIGSDLFADICKSQELRGAVSDREYIILLALVHMYLLDAKIHPTYTSDALTRWSLYALDLARGTSLATLKENVDRISLTHFKKAAEKAKVYDGKSTFVWPVSSGKFLSKFDFSNVSFPELHAYLSRSELSAPGNAPVEKPALVDSEPKDPLYPAWLYSGAAAQFYKEVDEVKAGRSQVLSGLSAVSLLKGVSEKKLLVVLGNQLSSAGKSGHWERHVLVPQQGEFTFPDIADYRSDNELMQVYNKFANACGQLEELYDALMHQVGIPSLELESTICKLLKS